EPLAKGLRRKQPKSGGGELDRQWQPIEPAADLPDDRGVVVGELEVRTNAAGPIDEQLNGLRATEIGRRDATRFGRQRERRYGQDLLGSNVERLAARDDGGDSRALAEEVGHDPGRRGHLLEVVEDEEDLPLVEAIDELLEDRPIDGLAEATHAGEGDED